MAGNEEAALVKQIVQAYHASGIPAKSFRGRPFVCREHGWEGPLDTYQLCTTQLGYSIVTGSSWQS
jgi:hypothetical protein